jgi:hypothetical protein
MTVLSNPNLSGAFNAKPLYQIVGFACIAGFLIDISALIFPPNFGAIEWRLGLMQQLGDRGIIMLFGLVFLMVGSLEMRQFRKQLSMICLGLGLIYLLGSVLSIRDAVNMQKLTSSNISAQSNQVQEKLQAAKDKPPANLKVTPEDIEKALQQVNVRTEAAQKGAQTQILKTGFSSVGNLIVIGLALIGVGRYGMRPSR